MHAEVPKFHFEDWITDPEINTKGEHVVPVQFFMSDLAFETVMYQKGRCKNIYNNEGLLSLGGVSN